MFNCNRLLFEHHVVMFEDFPAPALDLLALPTQETTTWVSANNNKQKAPFTSVPVICAFNELGNNSQPTQNGA